MKRTWSMVMVLAMVTSLCACGGGGKEQTTAATQQAASSEAKESSEAVQAEEAQTDGETIVLKYAAAEVPGTPENEANLNFIKTIEEKSNGRIKVEYYHSSQLGNDK